MGTENVPAVEIRWFDSALGTWQDITAEVQDYSFEDTGIQQVPEIELALYNPDGKYTNPGSANYIDPYSLFRVRVDARGVWDTVFLGRVNEHNSKIVGKNPDYMPLVCRGMADILLRDTITWSYADEQEVWAPKTPALWTFRSMVQDFLDAGDSGFSTGIVLEALYDASKIDMAVTAGMNFDETPLLNAIRDVAEELQLDGYVDGMLLSGRVLDLPFEWSKDSIAYDYSGEGNDGTLTNMEDADWVTGKYGRGLHFDGVNEFVSVPNDTSLNSASFSVEFWFKADTNRTQGLVDKWVANGWRIFMHVTTGVIEFDAVGEVGNIQTSATTAGTWYHIVATYDDNTNEAKLYLNAGTPSSASSVDYQNTYTNPFVVSPTHGARFDGVIDEVRMYNRVLSSQEVEMLYLHPRLRLVLYEVGTITASPAVTLTHPYKTIKMNQTLDDVMNHIYLVGGIDEGAIVRDKITEQGLSKYSPVIWSLSKGSGLADSQTYVTKGAWSIKGTTDSTGLIRFVLDVTNITGFSGGIDLDARHTSISFKMYSTGTARSSGILDNDVRIFMEDDAGTPNRIRYNIGKVNPKDAWSPIVVPMPSEIKKSSTGIFGIESPRHGIWVYITGSTFNAANVTKIEIWLNQDFIVPPGYSITPYDVYIDDFIFAGGREIDPFLYPALFPNSNVNGGYEDLTSINTYGLRSYVHRDAFIRTFEQAEYEANRILDQLKDITKMKKITVIKGAKVWVKPHQNITLTASEYGLSSTIMRVVSNKHDWKRGNYYRTALRCVQQSDPTPPFAGGPGSQLMVGTPPRR